MANGAVTNISAWSGTPPANFSAVTFDLEVDGGSQKGWIVYPTTGGPFTTIFHMQGGIADSSALTEAALDNLGIIAKNGGDDNLCVVALEHPGIGGSPHLGTPDGDDDFGGEFTIEIQQALMTAIENDGTISTKALATGMIVNAVSRGAMDATTFLRKHWFRISGIICASGLYDPRGWVDTAERIAKFSVPGVVPGFSAQNNIKPLVEAAIVPVLLAEQLSPTVPWLIHVPTKDEEIDPDQSTSMVNALLSRGLPATSLYFNKFDGASHNFAGFEAEYALMNKGFIDNVVVPV